MGFKQFQNRLLDQSCRECQAKPEWDWWFCPAGGIGERAAGVWDWKAAARGMGNELTGDAGATVGGGCRGCDLVCGHQVGIALDGELEDRSRNRVVDGVLRVKVVDESMDEEVFDQDLYFKRYEIMTRFLSKQYPDLEETFLDHLVEELYGNLFEENTK